MPLICRTRSSRASSLGLGIELRGFDHQQRRRGVVEEEVLVRLVQLAQVLGVGLRHVAARDRSARLRRRSQQHVGRRLQIDDEIGRRHVARQQVEQPLVDEQLVVVEIQIREDLVAVEDVVADRRLLEQVGLPQAGQLAMAVEQVEQLRLQRRAGPLGVEVGEERILGVFEDRRAVDSAGQPLGQPRLADADRAFDGEIAKRHVRRRV